MNENKKIQFVGTGLKNNRIKEAQPNKNEPKINCFYNSKLFPCSFTTPESHLMEKHYKKEHYLKAKETSRG
jgi:hypothetical protein